MKLIIITLHFLLLSFYSNAQGLNIQETLAEKEGKSTTELFEERKEERKTKREEKRDLKSNQGAQSDIVRKEDLEHQ
ncbi:hypothetical protein [Flammeovirga aprica]|uniref:Uncharacterized protein n=1 Tax=Flammeovirga aprica JL-4 TaxID=694437 RepID=A0A7X9S0S0_9BACT|nr:hypothetical protein [Flammeovirga aprica]NME72216.1 hypothetical protein [Flammeovirga aprica JL-4]